ncbi:DNA-binding transcriptional MerR regulator [Altererythrobacter atlanticus]|uniref:Mercuric resistance operon regulatory protein n=1 Tax=Croceibacterium atlanticum TaxID=1267766 RepID=A0A0F7KYM3_9SPHN|nr:MerR family transcriptional regulator [Croceibacterium atlanticum]AKH44351.1 Mercuric resistance operon regulatory protein [Croceibacterium atlanticum]MBB5733932.1 DNA-binding transcriptional MerR regulator [Croceibacterium atlanticum]
MKMKELEQATGVNRETIRVYLREGLVPQPERSGRTVADYGDQHVEAILAVRRLQRENRLTLAQIKALVSGSGTGKRVDESAFDDLETLVLHRASSDQAPVPLDSLVERYPKARQDAKTMSEIGIIDIIETDHGEALSLTSAQLVSIWGDMRNAGFDETLDYSPDILGFYVEASEFVGAWEAKTFLDHVEGRMDVNEAARLVEAAMPLMLNFFGLMRRCAFFRHVDAFQHARETSKNPSLNSRMSGDA